MMNYDLNLSQTRVEVEERLANHPQLLDDQHIQLKLGFCGRHPSRSHNSWGRDSRALIRAWGILSTRGRGDRRFLTHHDFEL